MLTDKYIEYWIPEPNTGCYIWIGYTRGGRGTKAPAVSYLGKTRNLCRYLCEEAHGPPPTPMHQAAHNTPNGCVGQLCVNEAHIRWATPSENTLERANGLARY